MSYKPEQEQRAIDALQSLHQGEESCEDEEVDLDACDKVLPGDMDDDPCDDAFGAVCGLQAVAATGIVFQDMTDPEGTERTMQRVQVLPHIDLIIDCHFNHEGGEVGPSLYVSFTMFCDVYRFRIKFFTLKTAFEEARDGKELLGYIMLGSLRLFGPTRNIPHTLAYAGNDYDGEHHPTIETLRTHGAVELIKNKCDLPVFDEPTAMVYDSPPAASLLFAVVLPEGIDTYKVEFVAVQQTNFQEIEQNVQGVEPENSRQELVLSLKNFGYPVLKPPEQNMQPWLRHANLKKASSSWFPVSDAAPLYGVLTDVDNANGIKFPPGPKTYFFIAGVEKQISFFYFVHGEKLYWRDKTSKKDVKFAWVNIDMFRVIYDCLCENERMEFFSNLLSKVSTQMTENPAHLYRGFKGKCKAVAVMTQTQSKKREKKSKYGEEDDEEFVVPKASPKKTKKETTVTAHVDASDDEEVADEEVADEEEDEEEVADEEVADEEEDEEEDGGLFVENFDEDSEEEEDEEEAAAGETTVATACATKRKHGETTVATTRLLFKRSNVNFLRNTAL